MLLAAARELVPPVGVDQVGVMIDDAGSYRACWLVGLRRVPMGPSFSRPHVAAVFARIVKGETPQ